MKRTLLLFTAVALMAAMMAIASLAQAQTFMSSSGGNTSSSNTSGFSNSQPITIIGGVTGDIGGIDFEPSTVSFPGFEFTGGTF